MKKYLFFLIATTIPFVSGAQFCVTTFYGEDFGLNDLLNSIDVLEIDSSGNIWFGQNSDFNNGDVGYFTGSQWFAVAPTFLPDPRPNAIAFDQDDSAWVATRKGLGVISIATREGRKMTPDNSGLPEADVTGIGVDRENHIWAGFSSGKVARYNGSSWEVFADLSGASVNTIEIARDSSVLLGFAGSPGLVRYHGGTFDTIPGFTNIKAITADRLGRVLVASHDSMVIFSGPLTRVVKAAPGNVIRDIAVGDGTGIWASSGQGLLFRRGDHFLRLSSNNSGVPAILSHPIEFSRDNQLWFGYRYQGATHSYSGTGYLYRTDPPAEAIVTADKSNYRFCHGDSLTLTADTAGNSYVWPDGSSVSNTYVAYDETEIPVAVEGDNRCYFYDTIHPLVQRVFEDEVICVTSVDTSQKVIIVWEKTPDVGTMSYNIYREVGSDEYEPIGNMAAGVLSVFEDPDADPRKRPYRYKISCVDTCGNESGKSFYHQTVHLATNKGALPGEVNLQWVDYEGLNIGKYIIYKGPGPLDMEPYDSVPGTVNQYTDSDVFDTVYYKVGFRLPASCWPTSNAKAGVGPYHHALSNLDDNRKMLSGIPAKRSPQVLHAWPNPFTDLTRIEFPNQNGTPYSLMIFRPGGKKVKQIERITSGEVIIRRENLNPGFYLFELRGERIYRGKIMVR